MAAARYAPPNSAAEQMVDNSQPSNEQPESHLEQNGDLETSESPNDASHYQSHGYAPPQVYSYHHYQPVNQPSYQPVSQPSYQPVHQQTYQPVSQPIYQPVNQPSYQPVSQSSYQPVNQQSYQPDNRIEKLPQYSSPGPSGSSSYAANTIVVRTEGLRMQEPLETEHVGSYLFLSVVNFLCCCAILGLVAIVMSILARHHNYNGETEMARRFSKAALGLNIAGIICGVIIIIALLAVRPTT